MTKHMAQMTIWIPDVMVCRHERTGDFMLIRHGTMEGCGASFAMGPIISVSKGEMMEKSLEIIQESLRFYRRWPVGTDFDSEIGNMSARKRSKFINEHLFVSVLQRDEVSITVCPEHREGKGWNGITGYSNEERQFKMPITPERFYEILVDAFERAT